MIFTSELPICIRVLPLDCEETQSFPVFLGIVHKVIIMNFTQRQRKACQISRLDQCQKAWQSKQTDWMFMNVNMRHLHVYECKHATLTVPIILPNRYFTFFMLLILIWGRAFNYFNTNPAQPQVTTVLFSRKLATSLYRIRAFIFFFCYHHRNHRRVLRSVLFLP